MLPVITPVIVGGLTTLIGNFFFHRKKQIVAEREFRAAELTMANQVFDDVSLSMAALAESSRDAMWALVLRPDRDNDWTPEDAASWRAYNEQLVPWNRARARNLALTRKYFGDQAASALKQIQDDLGKLESQVSATYFGRTESRKFLTRQNVGKKYIPISDRLLDTEIVALTETMIDKIQLQEVGALKGAII